MKIKVKLQSRPPEIYEIPSNSSVKFLKQKIQENSEIDIEQQRLIYGGKILNDGLLRDFHICDGVVVQMVVALRGG